MRILVPVDGSPLSESALSAIARWPSFADADVKILSIIDADAEGSTEASPNAEFFQRPGAEPGRIPQVQPAQFGPVVAATADPPPRVVETRGEALGREKNEREDYVRQLVQTRLPGMANVQMLVDYSDDPAAVIVEQAQKLDADIIAMATHGRSGVRRMLAGSVAERVMREASVPVLLIGPGAQESDASRAPA